MATRPWLDHYPVQWDLDCPELSLYHYLKQTAEEHPEQIALIYSDKQISYREMLAHIDRVAAAFAAKGLQKGDRVALLLPNSPAFVYSFYGALRQGLVVVPVDALLTAREVGFIIRDTKARVLIVVDALYHLVEEAMLDQEVENIIIFPLFGEADSTEARYFDELLQPHHPPPPPVPINPEKDYALITLTSGTTGFPKGVMLTHGNIIANAEATHEVLREWKERHAGENTLSLALLPFFGAYSIICSLIAGLTIPAGQILIPLIDIDLVLEMIHQHKPAIIPGVPGLYQELLKHPRTEEHSLDSIKICISGDSPMPVEALEEFEEKTGSSILEGYGLTEASPITHCNPLLGVRKPGSVGIPYPGTDCKIMDLESGERELPPGEKGELAVSGPQVMKGYWNLPNKTVNALRNGWLYTGDIAYMDEDGYFYIVDRKINMINYAGNKIFPSEIEKVIYEHPGVAEAVCIGVPEKYFGEVVKAFVVLQEEARATAEEIIDFCRSRLVKFKVPRRVELRSELPKSAAGKILRYQLIREEQHRRLLDR